ncbi:iron-containing alcohol dehydrogenase family protein [Orbus wheelerorum]|uniref:iron-containing alcohol dehydrogenase family protein n=1 Tax=Orbus wheelerorum TaxID=3074111 RepID=UPI00370DBA50
MLKIQTPKNYLQEPDILTKINSYVAEFGDKVYIVAGEKAWAQTQTIIEKSLTDANIQYQVDFYYGRCNAEKLQILAKKAVEFGANVVIGVGGGSIMDASKAISEYANQLPVIQVPTIAATCAAWSPFSVFYNLQGGHDKSFALTRFPEWILVDSNVLIKAPVRFLKSGITDAIAKWYEFSPYLKTSNDVNLLLQLQVAKLTLDILVENSDKAIKDNIDGKVSEAFSHTVDAAIALAGLANSVRDSSQRSGMAHSIHDSLTHVPQLASWVHGEKVGYGLAVQTILEYPNPSDRLPLLKWLARLDIPLTPAQLSTEITDEMLIEIADRVKVKPNAYKLLPFDVSPESIRKAMLESKSLAELVKNSA